VRAIKIAKTLNREHIAPPRGDRLGWAPTAIREILWRELYRGVIVWNRSQKTVRGGTKAQRKRPEDQWLRIELPRAADRGRGTMARCRKPPGEGSDGVPPHEGTRPAPGTRLAR
jgi:hypothetical protein